MAGGGGCDVGSLTLGGQGPGTGPDPRPELEWGERAPRWGLRIGRGSPGSRPWGGGVGCIPCRRRSAASARRRPGQTGPGPVALGRRRRAGGGPVMLERPRRTGGGPVMLERPRRTGGGPMVLELPPLTGPRTVPDRRRRARRGATAPGRRRRTSPPTVPGQSGRPGWGDGAGTAAGTGPQGDVLGRLWGGRGMELAGLVGPGSVCGSPGPWAGGGVWCAAYLGHRGAGVVAG
ncbi:hypothetical protein HD596_005707 [Nonomuraea jabiensis]|uniref:Uncharacterized protein n=1 Tax=Nonomuraea jabiensis TaxID=882448 RepID=A0A7W9G864_9ACTN|nr:hypothetical protein [Nonomuraea jabiensis]